MKFEVLNVFNNQKLIGFDTTIDPDYDGPVDALGLPLELRARAELRQRGTRIRTTRAGARARTAAARSWWRRGSGSEQAWPLEGRFANRPCTLRGTALTMVANERRFRPMRNRLIMVTGL